MFLVRLLFVLQMIRYFTRLTRPFHQTSYYYDLSNNNPHFLSAGDTIRYLEFLLRVSPMTARTLFERLTSRNGYVVGRNLQVSRNFIRVNSQGYSSLSSFLGQLHQGYTVPPGSASQGNRRRVMRVVGRRPGAAQDAPRVPLPHGVSFKGRMRVVRPTSTVAGFTGPLMDPIRALELRNARRNLRVLRRYQRRHL